MYSENVSIVRQIAQELSGKKPINRELQFEKIFYDYLNNLSQKYTEQQITVNVSHQPNDLGYDFMVIIHNQILLFEIKLYNSKITSSRILSVCERTSALEQDGIHILIVATEVSNRIKHICYEKYGVHIWDVGNLLWLFDEFPKIKSEFVAFLDYAVDNIEAMPPVFKMLSDIPTDSDVQHVSDDSDLIKKISAISPGRDHFTEYENVCIDILKYVLGDYLTLWKKQEISNDGLYRFDLCCKIKAGISQDFFDTIKNYFNTKYIVFEFKNTTDKIGQKEIYTTEKYLYEKALRKVAIIISRTGPDEHALRAVKGSLRESGKLILCLSDKTLIDMINIKKGDEQEPADILGNILDDLLLHLEK